MSRAAAFFELDHVMMPGSAVYLLARDLRAHDVFGARDLARIAIRRAKTRTAMESDKDIGGMGRDVLSAIAGRQQDEVRGWCHQVAAVEILPRIYPDIARIIAAHNAAGHRTYLVTSTPQELAHPVALELGMNCAAGNVAELDAEGRYTGRRAGSPLIGEVKRKAVLELARQEDLDLTQSHVYAGSADDKQLLKSVGFPHAVNPEWPLLRTAVRRGWAVHEMRPVRRKLTVGGPPAVPIGALIGTGFLAGYLRRRHE